MRYRLFIVIATIIWGSSFVIVKDVTNTMAPAWILAVRFTAAAIIMAVALLSRRSLYFVEIKRKAQIGREAIEQVDSQVRAIGRRNGVSARTALVYEGELSPVVGADGYFDAIVPFADLLGARDR